MNRIGVIAIGALLLLLPAVLVRAWTSAAEQRLAEAEAAAQAQPAQVAIAAEANEAYCTPGLKQVLRRVLQSCGLLNAGGGRGCQPLEAKSVATMSGADFNALFVPMKERGGIVQFEKESNVLDDTDKAMVEQLFADRRGASYFFVVARASPEGGEQFNRELSRSRAESVLTHLQQTFQDPDLQQQVGLLWLGEEFAQLEDAFCDWRRSGAASGAQCLPEDLNRSAFMAWIDCTL
jgi:outer membrane protein OmpA-like peptidoglycan-associated protein